MFEAELHYKRAGHAGAIRVLSFLNRANAGTYADALRLAKQSVEAPDVTATHTTAARSSMDSE